MINKVLLIGWNSYGGANRAVDKLVYALEKRSIEVDVGLHFYGAPLILETSKKVTDFKSFEEFMRVVDLGQYNVIHAHSCTISGDTLTRVRDRVPIVSTAHSLLVHDFSVELPNGEERTEFLLDESVPLEDRIRWAKGMKEHSGIKDYEHFQNAIFRYAERIVLLTQFGRDIFRCYYPEYEGKEVIVPNGSDFHKYATDPEVSRIAARIRHRIGDDSKIILYCGRISRAKGVIELAQAFNQVHDQHPNSKLLLVGKGDALNETLKTVNPGFRDDVKVEEWVDDEKKLAAFYKASEVCVIPSHHESFSLTGLEATMMGTPLIMTDVDGSHYAFIKPLYAYDARRRSPDLIVHWINWLFSNPERARLNAERVQKSVIRNYSLDRHVSETMDIYQTAIKRWNSSNH